MSYKGLEIESDNLSNTRAPSGGNRILHCPSESVPRAKQPLEKLSFLFQRFEIGECFMRINIKEKITEEERFWSALL